MGSTAVCPLCRNPMERLGDKAPIPKREDDEGWNSVAATLDGFRHMGEAYRQRQEQQHRDWESEQRRVKTFVCVKCHSVVTRKSYSTKIPKCSCRTAMEPLGDIPIPWSWESADWAHIAAELLRRNSELVK